MFRNQTAFLLIFYIIIKSKLRNTLHFYQISMFVCVVTINF